MAAVDIFVLYADLDYALIRAAMRPKDRSRVVLATSLAENAVMVPDIDWVLDSRLGRHQNQDDGIPYTLDYKASKSVTKEREGRAGRTKLGFRLRFCCTNCVRNLDDLPVSISDMMRVIALEGFHCKILVKDCLFAYACDDEMAVAEQRFDALRLADDEDDLRKALTKMPLPLPLCTVVLHTSRVFLSVLLRLFSALLRSLKALPRFLRSLRWPSRLASGTLGMRLPPSSH